MRRISRNRPVQQQTVFIRLRYQCKEKNGPEICPWAVVCGRSLPQELGAAKSWNRAFSEGKAKHGNSSRSVAITVVKPYPNFLEIG